MLACPLGCRRVTKVVNMYDGYFGVRGCRCRLSGMCVVVSGMGVDVSAMGVDVSKRGVDVSGMCVVASETCRCVVAGFCRRVDYTFPSCLQVPYLCPKI